MFYLNDVLNRIRYMLNDTETAYRYPNMLITEFVDESVREIRRMRPDAAFDENGDYTEYEGVYRYDESSNSANFDQYNRIDGWDRYTREILYFGMTDADTLRIYESSADRTADSDHLAQVDDCSSAGEKRVEEANSSGFKGIIEVTSPPGASDTLNVTAYERDLSLDDQFQPAVVNYVCSRCFDIDAEDTVDRGLSDRFYAKFLGNLGF